MFFFCVWLRYRAHSLFKKRCSVWRFEKTMYHLDEMGTIWIRNVCSVWMKTTNILTPSRCNALICVGFAIGSYFFLKKIRKWLSFVTQMDENCVPNGWNTYSRLDHRSDFHSEVEFACRWPINFIAIYNESWHWPSFYLDQVIGGLKTWCVFIVFFFLFFLLHFCAAIYYRKVRPNQWILRVGNHTFPIGFLTLLQIVCGQ